MPLIYPIGLFKAGLSDGVVGIGSNANASGATVTLSNVTVPTGALIFVMTMEDGTAGGTLSDGGVNTYTDDGQATGQIGNWHVFYKLNATALSAATLTYTKQLSGVGVIAAFYWTGHSAATLDATVTAKNNGATGTTTSPTITSGAPAVSNELMVGCLWTTVTGSLVFTQDTGNGWSSITGVPFIQESGGNNVGLALGYQINSGTSAKTFNPTWNTATRWAISTYGFKPS